MKKAGMILSLAALLFLTVLKMQKMALAVCALAILLLSALLWRSGFLSARKEEIKPRHILAAVFLCGIMGLIFYETWTEEGRLEALTALLPLDAGTLVLVLAAAGAIAAIPITVCGLEKLEGEWRNSFGRYGTLTEYSGKTIRFWKAVLLLGAVFLVGISALLRANVNYIDDIGRTARGYKDWGSFSRFLSNGLSTIVHSNSYLTDVSPLAQILAVGILALAGVILLAVLFERKEFTVWEVLAAVPIGLNPYFLECLSYKFDAPYMALSILAAILPLVLIRAGTGIYIAASAVGTVMVCTSYQASTGIFPIVVILLVLRMWMKKTSWKQILQFVAKSVLGYGLGLVFFFLVIMIPADTYVSSSLPGLGELLPNFVRNLKQYYATVMADFPAIWSWASLLVVLAFVWWGLSFTGRNKILALVMTGAALLLQAALCFGVYPALTVPSYSPRAMYGFGILLALLCVCAAEHRKNIFIRVPGLALCWIFFTFAFTYGNALSEQKVYLDFRREIVISDLNDMGTFTGDDPVVVQIEGNAGVSPVVQSMLQQYPILKRLVPITFQGEWVWGKEEFYHYYGMQNVVWDESQDLSSYDLPLLEDHMYHAIYGDEGYVLVVLK